MVAMEKCCSGPFLGLVVVVVVFMVTFPMPVRGAPAYATRHPRREPPCTHTTHATLCWTVQLKPPLHYRLTQASAESLILQDSTDSVLHSDWATSPNLHQQETGDSVRVLVKGSNFSSRYSGSESVSLSSKRDVTSKMKLSANLSLELGSQKSSKEALLNKKTTNNTFQSQDPKKTDSNIETPHHQKVYVYHQMALLLAEEVGLSLLGKVGELYDHFVLCHDDKMENTSEDTWSRDSSPETYRESGKAFQHYHQAHTDLKKLDAAIFEEIEQRAEAALHHHPDVAWFTMETVHHRQKRALVFNDPVFRNQWHLVNHVEIGMDINVTGVWQKGITGAGVTVAVVDDGLEWNNPDLHDNYDFLGSWDLNDNDPDPMPNSAKASNHHGTRCAGEIAAVANNNVCGVGVAYGAKVAGIRLLDGPMTDSLEAEAFNKKFDINAVYSCSWGPDDDGKTVDGPHILAAKAMKFGVEFGRHGYGSIFVVASGNGGSKEDNCNYDGYANSIYTVTIGAVDESGAKPYYAEECASMLGVTFSSGIASKRDIVTTDWRQKGSKGCTDRHTGTSAAAPLAAGMIALMLDAQPCLTWRDVQYILIITSVKIDRDLAHWQKNGAGLEHSHKHGFGLISAWRMVNAARVWRSVPWMTSYSEEETGGWDIPHGLDAPLIVRHTVTLKDIAGYSLYMLEYVQVTVTLSHPFRGKLGIHLRCPSNTVSVIGAPRPNDNATEGFTDWTFTTVRCWGEAPIGDWTLVITDSLPADSPLPIGHLSKWRLTLFGTPMSTSEFQERRQEVEAAMTGEYLSANFTPPCDPPPVTTPPYIPLSEKTLKILFLASVFCVVFALYETLEYMLCYGEEKRQQVEETRRAMSLQRAIADSTSPETARLLNEENEQDTEWLRQSQSAFSAEDDEDDDMFFLDSGIASQIRQARDNVGRRNRPAGEKIPMSTLRTLPGRTSANDSREDSRHLRDILPSGTSRSSDAGTSGNFNVGASVTTPNLLSDHDLGASLSGGHGQREVSTESHSGGILVGRGTAQNSILPDMWKALTPDRESDNESLEDELFSREKESNRSLLRNSVRKSYR